jgi:hypothetical protein
VQQLCNSGEIIAVLTLIALDAEFVDFFAASPDISTSRPQKAAFLISI